jgi:hypothetical protein
MAVTKLGLCNQALCRIGASRINTFDYAASEEIPKEAELCLLWWDQVVDEVLCAHPWNCAITRADISASQSAGADWGYTYKYQLPVNPKCLRVLEMEDSDTEWRVEGGYLYTDETEVCIMYVARITNPALFTPLLAKAIYSRLAQVLLPALTENVTLGDVLENEYRNTMSEARGTDAMESSIRELDTTTWLDARK